MYFFCKGIFSIIGMSIFHYFFQWSWTIQYVSWFLHRILAHSHFIVIQPSFAVPKTFDKMAVIADNNIVSDAAQTQHDLSFCICKTFSFSLGFSRRKLQYRASQFNCSVLKRANIIYAIYFIYGLSHLKCLNARPIDIIITLHHVLNWSFQTDNKKQATHNPPTLRLNASVHYDMHCHIECVRNEFEWG